MRFLLRLVMFVVALAVALLAIGFILPNKAHVERSTTIAAPPSTVFALVNSFRQFEKWSPWATKDPSMKVERSGPELGVGAKYVWAGNSEVGTGSQEIIASTPLSEVKIKLVFGGFDGASEATMTIAPDGAGSKLTWALDSQLGDNPINHYFGLFMDKMVGPDYVSGLAKLKTLAESLPKTDFADLKIELIDNKPLPYAYVSGATTTDGADIGKALGAAYGKVGVLMKSAGLKQVGAPLAVARRWDPQAKVYEFDAGIPVDRIDAVPPAGSEVKYAQTPAGQVLMATHKGPYAGLGKTYEHFAAFEAAYGFAEVGNSWEQYVSDPGSTPEAELVTTVNVAVK